MLDGPDRSLTRPAGQRLSQWANCECRAWCSLLRKVTFHREVRDPLFAVCAQHFFEGSSAAVWWPYANQFRKQFFSTHGRMRKKTSAPWECTAPNLMAISSGLACFFFFHSPNLRNRWGWSLPSDCSNFEAEKTSALCTLNFYDVQCTPAKRRSPWGNSKNRGKPQESANQRARYF